MESIPDVAMNGALAETATGSEMVTIGVDLEVTVGARWDGRAGEKGQTELMAETNSVEVGR
jgi:hypothetical protein